MRLYLLRPQQMLGTCQEKRLERVPTTCPTICSFACTTIPGFWDMNPVDLRIDTSAHIVYTSFVGVLESTLSHTSVRMALCCVALLLVDDQGILRTLAAAVVWRYASLRLMASA